ncbi:uncharacterized protein DUF2752 [Nocardia neocaledoniensis]|uniref:Uncharacterized protein DUF2752 n=1 Tax=Nocardia neocaledoniensis TaxID=236511 RepID=A0A317N2L6_9NOCA|nr:uncharacterized protein DUF2752 [Nocardia neocaledoniensis]
MKSPGFAGKLQRPACWTASSRPQYRGSVDSTPVMAENPSTETPPVWRRLAPPLITAGLGIGTLALLHFRDPHVEGSYGLCPVYALFGVYCPGCGGMRAMHNLTDGRVLDSLHSNILALPLVIAFAVFVVDWALRARRGERWRLPGLSAVTVWSFVGVLTAYTVLRNTPWGTWLTPV